MTKILKNWLDSTLYISILFTGLFFASLAVGDDFLPNVCLQQNLEAHSSKSGMWTMQCQSKAPVFDAFLSLKIGPAIEKSGLSAYYLLAELLQSSEDVLFQEELLKNVGHFSVIVDQNWLTVHFGGLSENAAAITKIVEDKLKKFTSRPSSIHSAKTRALQWIDAVSESSEQAAMYVLDERIYSLGGELSHAMGSRAQLKSVKQKHIDQAFASLRDSELLGYFYGPRSVIDNLKNRWAILPSLIRSQKSDQAIVSPKRQISHGDDKYSSLKPILVVPSKNRQNASVSMAFVKELKQIYSYELLEAMLAGFTSSRLNQRLREEKAMTYSVSASGHYLNGKVYFKIQASTESKMVGVLVKEIKSIWNGLVYDFDLADKHSIDRKDFEMAQTYLKSTLPVKFQTIDSIGRLFFIQKKNGLDLEQLNAYNQGIDSLSPEKFKNFLEQECKNTDWYITVAGPEKEISQALKDQGFAFDKVHI